MGAVRFAWVGRLAVVMLWAGTDSTRPSAGGAHPAHLRVRSLLRTESMSGSVTNGPNREAAEDQQQQRYGNPKAPVSRSSECEGGWPCRSCSTQLRTEHLHRQVDMTRLVDRDLDRLRLPSRIAGPTLAGLNGHDALALGKVRR